jgi:pilus assembly protein Flp/PilA
VGPRLPGQHGLVEDRRLRARLSGNHIGERGLNAVAARVGVHTARETGPLFLAFLNSRSGGTAIEYALIAALIAVVVLGGIQTAGASLLGTMDYVGAALQTAAVPEG